MFAIRHAVGNRWRRHGVGADRHADVSWSCSARRAPVMDPVLLLARPELMRVAPLGGLRARKHVAGTSVIGATLTSGNCSQLFEPGHLTLNGSNEWNDGYGVSPTISCHFQFGWRDRQRRASTAAEVGPDGRDGGRGGVRAAASKMGETGKAVGKCIELPVIDRNAGRA
jgi:hypothetical protein